MLCSMFMLLKCKDLNFKFQSLESPLLTVTFQTQGLVLHAGRELHAALNTSAQNPKLGINTKLNTRSLWRITNLFQFFL
jgi:hypothetical protein